MTRIMMSEMRVRFAPSPTGYLHVGGARTALFNYLFARAVGGTFLLRIEDTDPVRSRSELAQVILDGLRWLGIESDEPVVYQSDRRERFRQVAQDLLNCGAAYRDFNTADDIEALRQSSQERSEPRFRFRRDMAEQDHEHERIANGEPFAVRFAAPAEGVAWNDLVHGPIQFAGDDLEDFVLLRGDGTPTYHLSVVCDDHDMGITHVLRGDDHISNTPKQICIYRALGWELPHFGHVPLILGPDKQRLSKRTGATSVGEFQARGFLPQAMVNFLALLGWSPGSGDREIFSPTELAQVFTVEGIQPKSAVFDTAKLEWMNGEHLRKLSDDEAVGYLLNQAGDMEASREQLLRLWPLMRPRIRLPRDLFEDHVYFFTDPHDFDAVAVQRQFGNTELVQHVRDYASALTDVEAFTAESLEVHLRDFCAKRQLSAGKLIHPLRLALTGRTVSPGLFELMAALGRDNTLHRLQYALNTLVSP
jgi:glutamyl-tRNA synthetase